MRAEESPRGGRAAPGVWLAMLLGVLLAVGCGTESEKRYAKAKQAAFEAQDYEAALEWVDRAIQLDPEEGRYHRRRGIWLAELGRHEEALAALDEAVTVERPSESAHLEAIQLCLALNRFEETERRIAAARPDLSERKHLEELAALDGELRRRRDFERWYPEQAPEPAE